MDTAALKEASRHIVLWTGALAQSAYFARECHEAYATLGFDDSVAGEWRGRLVTDPISFHATRTAVLGDVPALVAAAVFPHMAPSSIELDVRPGGSLRMVEVFPDDPTVRVQVHINLT